VQQREGHADSREDVSLTPHSTITGWQQCVCLAHLQAQGLYCSERPILAHDQETCHHPSTAHLLKLYKSMDR